MPEPEPLHTVNDRLQFIAAHQSGMYTMTELAARYIESVRPPWKSPRTAEAIESRVLRFVESVEKMGVTNASDTNLNVVERYVKERIAAGVSARTVNRDLTPVARMLWFGRKHELITVNPLVGEAYKDLRLSEPDADPNKSTLSPVQIDAFIRRAYEVLPLAYASLFEVMAGTGIRLAEACHLELDDIDHAKKEIKIRPKKEWKPKKDLRQLSKWIETKKKVVDQHGE